MGRAHRFGMLLFHMHYPSHPLLPGIAPALPPDADPQLSALLRAVLGAPGARALG